MGLFGSFRSSERQEKGDILKESVFKVNKNIDNDKKNRIISPVSGYEPKYNPLLWNLTSRRTKTNCYAYALDIKKGIICPGQLSNAKMNSGTVSEFVEIIMFDAAALGRSVQPIRFYEKCPDGFYKIALAVHAYENEDKEVEQISTWDEYHFYRENPDATWSHKLGVGKVQKIDASGKIIINPLEADRRHWKVNFNIFVGFFAVSINEQKTVYK